MRWIYRHIDSLSTPCGEIVITDRAEKRCIFSVRQNPYRPDWHLFCETEKEELLNTDTNYQICIQASNLVLGCVYKICLIGNQLHFGDSDEHTEALSGTFNGYSIAIGAYDPNDDEKLNQACEYSQRRGFHNAIVPPPQYDESRFVQYDVEMLENYSGFSFRLLDDSIQEIVFPVAWIKNEYKNLPDYEAAVELWTT